MADINLGVGGANSAVGGYDIENSLKFESNNSEKLYHTLSIQGDLQQMSFSCWVKRTELGSEQAIFTGRIGASGEFGRIIFSPSDTIQFWMRNSGSTTLVQLYTNRVFRDTSAWYHIVFGIDTTQSTAADRVNLYINGVKETSFSSETYPTLNANLNGGFNRGTFNHVLGVEEANNTYFNGYIAEAHFVDGQQLAASDFGEFDEDTGIWKPKAYTGSYGTNGFYLDFENSASLGADGSGNSNNFTLSNITSADQATDTPTNNFCTLNPLYKCADTTMTDGATNCDRTNNANNTVRGTFVVTKGKWYWEVAVYRGTVNANYPFMGMTGNFTTDACSWLYGDSKSFYVSGSGNVEDAGTFRGSGTAAAQDPNYSIYGFAVDIDNEELYWYTNGTVNNSGNAYSISTSVGNSDEGMTPFLFMFTGANQSFNFGGYSVITPSSAASDANGYGNFEYAPPTGYYALCTKNLAEFG